MSTAAAQSKFSRPHKRNTTHPMDNTAHIKPGETYPACNRCQYIALVATQPICPYCFGNWTHNIARPIAEAPSPAKQDG